MPQTVQVEGYEVRRRMNTVFYRKLDMREHQAPSQRFGSAYATVLDDAVGALGLTVCLRMVSRRHRKLGTEQPPQRAPKQGCESRITIGHKSLGQTMVPEDVVHEHLCRLFCGHAIVDSRK